MLSASHDRTHDSGVARAGAALTFAAGSMSRESSEKSTSACTSIMNWLNCHARLKRKVATKMARSVSLCGKKTFGSFPRPWKRKASRTRLRGSSRDLRKQKSHELPLCKRLHLLFKR